MTAAPQPPRNRLFPSSTTPLFHIWDRMQRLQTDFCILQELGVYFRSSHWRSARRVLDLGTGNGYYLGRLAEHFPDKSWTGIDSSGPLLAVAARELRDRDVELCESDLSEFTTADPFDFVLMRLFLQHLPSVSGALDRAAGLTASGGALLVIDALDEERFFAPPAEAFSDFFAAYTALQRERGRERAVGRCVLQALEGRDDWTLGDRVRLVIPSTLPGNHKLFQENYRLFIDLVEDAGDLSYDFDHVRREWDAWCGRERAYMQVGLDILRLDRR